MGFEALVVSEDGEGHFKSDIVQKELEDLPPGEVLVRVHYSSLNYKDALSAMGNKGVTKQYPHTPGIDAAGEVEYVKYKDQNESMPFKPGDKVLVTGFDLGMNTAGGFAEYIRVPASWLVRCPELMSLKEAMILGTAGLTAGLCVDTLLQVGITPSFGNILVTGASGGVGSVALALLSQLGFEVHACTGSVDQENYLRRIGASAIVPRQLLLEGTDKALLKEQWGGVVDTVGGDILFNAIKATRYGGSVACCGMVAAADFKANVFPFILRGVNLLGIDSVNVPLDVREYIWDQFALPWRLKNLETISTEITLHQLPEYFEKILTGNTKGRVLINLQ